MPDGKLILLAYEKWGENSPKYLIGDFAFMIWDEGKQKLFGARDFSGTRPLYYYYDSKKFTFSTTMESLFSLPYISKHLNEEWLAEYLAITGTIDTVDARMTPYKDINQVPPSHSITISNNKNNITRYVSLYPTKKLKLKSDEEYVEAFQEVFQTAVNSRLRSTHKVGAQLSGGLDSGAVVGFANDVLSNRNQTLDTFSYIPHKDFKDFTPKQLIPDETKFINSTVSYLEGVNDHYVNFADKDPYSEIEDILASMEMPYKFFENSYWLKGMFEEAHTHNIGVLLNGDRGNFSISWGSAIDYYSTLLKKLQWVRLFQELNYYSKIVGGARLGRLPQIAKIGFPKSVGFISKEKPYRLPPLINPIFANEKNVFEKLKKHGIDESGWLNAPDIFKERESLFTNMFPWNSGNTFTAKLSLQYSLWKRDPTNDLRVVLFCLSVPESQYIQKGIDRALIRRSTKGILPDNVRLNQRFRGVQGVDWVQRMIPHWKSFTEEAIQLYKDKNIDCYFNKKTIKVALDKIQMGPRIECATDPDYKVLMRALILYRYMNRFI